MIRTDCVRCSAIWGLEDINAWYVTWPWAAPPGPEETVSLSTHITWEVGNGIEESFSKGDWPTCLLSIVLWLPTVPKPQCKDKIRVERRRAKSDRPP